MATSVKKSALVQYSPEEMFLLVDDIGAYESFLPWCKSSRVLSRSDEEVKATIELSKGGIEKSFTTSNRALKNCRIDMKLVDGPFKRLDGFWQFDPLGSEGCKVSLNLDFEFSSRILSLAVGPIFRQIADSLVDAFHARAVEVYGRR